MYIHFTDEAAGFIRERYFSANNRGSVKLVYDTDGCGCAVNGIAALWIVGESDDGDSRAESNAFPAYIDSRHELFFEERVVVDFHQAKRVLMLKSDSQIYNPAMRVTDKRQSTDPA
jgi:uncharacterized protein YqkB